FHAARRSRRGAARACRRERAPDRHRQRGRHRAGGAAAAGRALLAGGQHDPAGTGGPGPRGGGGGRTGAGVRARRGGGGRGGGGGEGGGAGSGGTLPFWRGKRSVAASPPRLPIDESLARWKPTLHGLKVLVVDDDEDTCETVGAVLRRAGAEVRTCLSAGQALRAMGSWGPGLLLVHIGMPGEGGLSAHRN